jgi:hypothetical protein
MKLLQILCFWALSIVLSLSKKIVLFIFQNTTFRRQDSPEIWTSSIDWAQLSRFYLKTEIESGLWNAAFWKINRTVFLIKTGRWIMSRNIILVLMYHRHKLLDLVYNFWFSRVQGYPCTVKPLLSTGRILKRVSSADSESIFHKCKRYWHDRSIWT